MPGRSGKVIFPFTTSMPFKTVVGYQQAPVQVGKVDRRRKLGGSTDGTRRLGHATYHHLHAEGARQRQHFPCLAHSRAFHQLDVDARKDALQGRYVLQPLHRLIGKDGQGALPGYPRQVVNCSLGMGCSTITTPCSFSQCIMSSARCLSFQPWLASTAMGKGVTERMVSISCLSWSLPALPSGC